jgi:hypothetical protein
MTNGDYVRSYVANMFNSKPSLRTSDYSPYGIIKNNIVLPAIDSASAYRNKTSTQQGRSTSMNKFVTRSSGENVNQPLINKVLPQTSSPATVAVNDRENVLPNKKDIKPKDKNGGLKAPPALVVPKKKTSSEVIPPVVLPTNETVAPISAIANMAPSGMGIDEVVSRYSPEQLGAMDFSNYSAGSLGIDAPIKQSAFGSGSDRGSFFNGTWSNPAGYTNEEWASLSPDEQAKLGANKSSIESGLGLASAGISAVGGLAGLYAAHANSKYNKGMLDISKQQNQAQLAQLRANDANKSAFAKAAGGTYVSSKV